MMYDDDQMLMLSGIQHYMFCPRQWALILCQGTGTLTLFCPFSLSHSYSS